MLDTFAEVVDVPYDASERTPNSCTKRAAASSSTMLRGVFKMGVSPIYFIAIYNFGVFIIGEDLSECYGQTSG